VYDAIIVGARAAGAATAVLLARKGLRVLALDRASFPSDTLSTHQIQLPGVARLAAWGLLEKVVASHAPPTRRVHFDQSGIVLDGRFPTFDGVDAVFSPRRTVLDAILVEAARAAGVEVREDVIVESLVRSDGRVSGVRGREKGGRAMVESARLVIGADGKHSLVAREVGAPAYHERSPRSMACYAYWEGVPVEGGEIYGRPRRAIGAWPTNDGLLLTYVAWPIEEFGAFRTDVAGNLQATLDLAGDLGERVRAGRRVERIRLTPDLPNRFRRPYGPGWALVGDAGLVLDPITGQGIGDAFRDAELLADAVEAGLGGGRPIEDALKAYQRSRDRRIRPMYDFTLDLAALRPLPAPGRVLFESLVGKQAEIDRFLGVLTGAVPIRSYLSPGNLVRLVGLRGLGRILRLSLAGPPGPRPKTAPKTVPKTVPQDRAPRPCLKIASIMRERTRHAADKVPKFMIGGRSGRAGAG
jgi:2-polyprenyl-6-methoxyphenol hydroxylase-like FAD-dependent oxidoreductase